MTKLEKLLGTVQLSLITKQNPVGIMAVTKFCD